MIVISFWNEFIPSPVDTPIHYPYMRHLDDLARAKKLAAIKSQGTCNQTYSPKLNIFIKLARLVLVAILNMKNASKFTHFGI